MVAVLSSRLLVGAPEGRTSLAQRFSAGKSGRKNSSPGGTAQFSLPNHSQPHALQPPHVEPRHFLSEPGFRGGEPLILARRREVARPAQLPGGRVIVAAAPIGGWLSDRGSRQNHRL